MFGGEHAYRPAARYRQRKRYSAAFGDVKVTQNEDVIGIHRELVGGSMAGVTLTRFEAMELAMKLARILEDKDE